MNHLASTPINHPGGTPHQPSRHHADGRAIGPTGGQLRAIIEVANITQERAAELCHVKRRAMLQWMAGDRRMPLANAELLCLAIVANGHAAPGPWMADWVRPELAAMARRGAP